MERQALIGVLLLSIASSAFAERPSDARHRRIAEARKAAQQEQERQAVIEKLPKTEENEKKMQASRRAYQGHTNEIASIGQSEPNDLDTQLAAGGAFMDLGEPSRGVPFLERGVQIGQDANDPKQEAKARGMLAQAHLQEKDFTRARDQAKLALALNPNEKSAQMALRMSEGRVGGSGKTASGRGAPSGNADSGATKPTTPVATAAATPNPALAIAFSDSKHEATLAAIRRALGLGDRAAAQRELDRARAEAADDSRLRLGAALIKRAAGDLSGALIELNEAARLDPNRAEIYAERALVRAKLGQKAEDIREDYLRGGGRERDFAAFYEAQAEKLGGGTPEAASGPGSGGGKSGWDYGMDPAAKRRQWVTRGLMGFGLVLVAAALLRLLKRAKDDSETGS